MASEVLIKISKDEKERARLLSEYKYQVDMQSKLVHAEREGMKKGREEGIALGHEQGRMETARNALARGVSPELIRDITGLDIEDISKIQAG